MDYQFYFAVVGSGTTTFGPAHYVNDEDIFACEFQHVEGDFAGVTVEIKNPRAGLLNEDRKQWVWISVRKPDNSVVPIFHGRIVGVPQSIDQATIRVEYVGRWETVEAEKKALAETLKVPPFWDAIWFDPAKIEPDVVLNARTQLWHYGRTDRTITVSDILQGEAGTIALNDNDILSLDIQYGNPIAKVHVEARVEWAQFARGTVDMSALLTQYFVAAGAPAGRVASYTGSGLEASWPKYADGIGGGWTVGVSFANLLNKTIDKSKFFKVTLDPSKGTPDIEIQDWWATSFEGYDFWYQKAYAAWLEEVMRDPITAAHFYLWEFAPTFQVNYEATRARSEVLTFDVEADLQAMLYDIDADARVSTIAIQTSQVGDPVDPDKGIPIGNVKRRSYFALDRGDQTISYLLNLARARILFAARAAEVTCEIPFDIMLGLSCRHDIMLMLDDLPGGLAGGKVIGYRFSMNAETGELAAFVTFGAVVGLGNALAPPSAGQPTYVVEGYVNDYQRYAGTSLQPIAGKLEYTKPKIVPKDDGIDFDGLRPENILQDFAATALLTFTGPGVAGNTITINGHVYTLRAALVGANDVLLGGSAEATANNLTAAINGDEAQIGSTFGTGTVANADVEAITADGIVRVTARVPGTVGNALAVSHVGTAMAWDTPTLHGGSHGLRILNGPTAQEAALNQVYPTVQEAIVALNEHFTEVEMALKPLTGGPFETPIALTVSKLMVPKTIDLTAVAL